MPRLPCLVVCACLVGGAPAYAQPPNGDRTGPATDHDFGQLTIVDAEPPADRLPPKRAVPDYDGRGKKPTTTGDDLLWIPRLLVMPIYLATEYLVRRPIGALVMAIERDKLAQRIIHIAGDGANPNVGFSPTFYWDSGFAPSIGLYAWWDKLGSTKNHVRAYVADWGPDVFTAAIADRYDLAEGGTASLRASYLLRDDNVFYGVGPDSKTGNVSRFEQRTFEAGPGYDAKLTPSTSVATTAGVRGVVYDDTSCCSDPNVQDIVRTGRLPVPPRLFGGGYTTLFDSAALTFDSRRHRHESGVRVSATGAPSFDVSERPGASWLRYEAHATAFWDVTKTERIVSLGASALFVDPLQGLVNHEARAPEGRAGGARGIPFTELIALGGPSLMRGFLPGRLVDRSAVVATLAYEWPIWAFLDGTLQTAVGNVFGAGLRGFDVDRLRFSGVVGIRSNSSPDHQFELLTGFGTEPFDQGATVTSFRLALGATRGF